MGELTPGVKSVLAAVWNDPGQDARNDAWWNERLGLRDGDGLAYYQLVLFNASDHDASVRLADGDLTIVPPGGEPVRMRSLAPVLSGSRSPSLARSLEALGSARETIELPPGKMATPFVAFPRRVGLGEATAVAGGDGASFRRRRIPRDRWEDLRAKPHAADLEDL